MAARRTPTHMRTIKVVSPSGEVSEMTIANARDCVRQLGFKYHDPSTAPKEQEQIVGEQRSIEDAVTPTDDDTSGDPTPEDIEPEVAEEVAEDEDTKSKRRGK